MVRNTYIYPPGLDADRLRHLRLHLGAGCRSSTRSRSPAITCRRRERRTISSSPIRSPTGSNMSAPASQAGLDIDSFAPRLSFFFAIGMNFFMEVAKLRAARLLWAQVDEELRRDDGQVAGAARPLPDLGLVADGAGRLQQRRADHASRRWRRRRAARSRSTPTPSTRRWRCRPTSPRGSPATPSSSCSTKAARRASSIRGAARYFVERLTADLAAKALGPYRRGRGARRHGQGDRGGPAEAADRGGGGADAGADRFRRAGRRRRQPLPARARSAAVDVLKVDNSAVRAAQIERLATTARRARRQARRGGARGARRRAPRGDAQPPRAAVEAARAKATVGEISTALENVFGRHRARDPRHLRRLQEGGRRWRTSGVARVLALDRRRSRRTRGAGPRILVAKVGQDGHDRGQKVIASAFADLGFDVDIGPLFATPEEVARQAVENDVHIVGVSTLAAGHLDAGAGAAGGARARGAGGHHGRRRRGRTRRRTSPRCERPARPPSSRPAPSSPKAAEELLGSLRERLGHMRPKG